MKGMNTSFSTSSSLSCSTRYAPIRQYCSGGSSTWSSIHPLFGVCSSGWLRKKQKRPPGCSTRATSAIASSTSRMCSNTRQATTASKLAVGERQRRSLAAGETTRRPAAAATLDAFHVGSMPTTSSAPTAAGEPADLPVAAADVEHAPRAGQLRRRERQDLLLVLRVGALGEALDPPAGVRLPQVPSAHRLDRRSRLATLLDRRCSHGRIGPYRCQRSRTGRRRRRGGWYVGETWRRRPRRRRRAATTSAFSSSSDARLTAFTPPSSLHEPLLAGLAEAGDAVERRSWSSACLAARGGTCWRSGGPRRGSAAA